ncbi:hypothetical protein [Pseudomonas sp. NPDC089569]|uniref:hypothetical protein n=1 Tax=Pseudomonas sp. NPDC089569 TaxID=3390722 RepID=UPI003CFF383C
MTRSIDKIMENHRVAAERRRAGKRIWDYEIDVKAVLHEDPQNKSNEHCASVANRIGALLRERLPITWLATDNDKSDETIIEIVEGMEALKHDSYEGENDITPLSDLNEMLAQLYDWADTKRVWLGL